MNKTFLKSNGTLRVTLTLLCIFNCLLISCVEVIDFEVERKGGQLVVDGKITNREGQHMLKLSRTSKEERISTPLSGANITIFDDLGNQEQYTQVEEGEYLLEGLTVKGIDGTTYFIEITLPDGSLYRSQPETMPRLLGSDSVYYEFDTEEELTEAGIIIENEVIRVFTDTSIPNSESPIFLKWDVVEVYKFTQVKDTSPLAGPPPVCYITFYPNPQNILLFNSEELQTNKLEQQLQATRKIDFSFNERHYFTVFQSSITREAYNYWMNVDQVINSTGTIFDVPAATVQGNIFNVNDANEEVLGYFEATAMDTTRFFLLPFDIPFFIVPPCGVNTRNKIPLCFDCLQTSNSTREKPDFF